MKKVVGICLSLLIVLFVADFIASILPSKIRRALPKSASEVQEYQWSVMTGDSTSGLKARMPESEVAAYAKQLDVTVPIEAATYSEIPSEYMGRVQPSAKYNGEDLGPIWANGVRIEGWDPPPRPRFFQFYREGTTIAVVAVGWANGWVYFSKWQGYGGDPPKSIPTSGKK